MTHDNEVPCIQPCCNARLYCNLPTSRQRQAEIARTETSPSTSLRYGVYLVWLLSRGT